MTVVDPETRVVGLEGLRVADSSIMPLITNGNLNAPTIMIGEKAADHILGRAPLRRRTPPMPTPSAARARRGERASPNRNSRVALIGFRGGEVGTGSGAENL